MQELQTGQESGENEQSAEKKDVSQTADAPRSVSRESLWGTVLLACMLIFVVASIGGVGWVAYTKWRSERVAKSQPSITILSSQANEEKNTAPAEAVPATDSTKTGESSTDDTAMAAKKLTISVLNGGGAKGSAGTLTEFLKTAGYSQAVAGNTVNNYMGVVLYYALGLEKEILVVKESVVKKYPQAKVLPADTKNKETSVSQVTIILGK